MPRRAEVAWTENAAATLREGGHRRGQARQAVIELLGQTGYCSEINICGSLWTTRVTSHVPLADVAGLITLEKVYDAARFIDRALKASGTPSPA